MADSSTMMSWLTLRAAEQGLVLLVVASIVALAFRAERRQVGSSIVFLALSFVARLAAELLRLGGLSGFERVCGFIALLFEGIAFVNLGVTLMFGTSRKLTRVEAPRILRDLTKAICIIGFVLYLFSMNHVDVSGIVATSAVITAIIGFSLQDVLSNIMGGIALHLDQSVEVGDWIKHDEHSGTVQEIGWRHTSILTRNGDRLIIPNSYLMKNAVLLQGKRWGGSQLQRRWVRFNVDFRYSPAKVTEVVTEALLRQPIEGVGSDPEPHTIFYDIKDSWGLYAVRYWLTDLRRDDWTDSIVRTRIVTALRRAQIPMSIPATTFFMQRDRGERKRLAEQMRHHSLRALEHVSLLSSLTDEERSQLADRLVPSPFVAGEAIIVQGQLGEDLFILTRGRAEVRVSVGGGAPTLVATLEAPDFFGEYGMLTGETRQASVVAVSEVECWRLSKENFQEVLEQRPSIADEVSRVLADREVGLKAVRENLSEQVKQALLANERSSILGRIERFFGLGE